MGRLHSQDYECEQCGWFDAVIVTLEHDDPRPRQEASPNTQECPQCGAEAVKRFGGPLVMNRALPDGFDRGDAWKIGKEIAHRKRERRNIHWKKRGEYDKEIARLTKRSFQKGAKDKGAGSS